MNTKLSILLTLAFAFANMVTLLGQSNYGSNRKANPDMCLEGKMQTYHAPSVLKQNIPITNDLLTLTFDTQQQFDLKKSDLKSHPKFITPLRQKEGISDPGFYSITAYYDHDPLFPGFLIDYRCGNHTYDLPTGYNHAGTDFFLWPFPWKQMYQDEAEVIAAAPGIIVNKQDGFFDQSCEDNTEPWNGIGIRHEDGSTSWYIHLKKNSLTEDSLGAFVQQGEYLGIAGSSGQSYAPHLHFEVYNSEGLLIDPFEGPCNNTIPESWWQTQEPYKISGLNRLATNFRLPEFPDCPEKEIPNESNIFYPNDTIWLLSYYRNVFFGDTISISVFRPNGLLHSTRVWLSPTDFLTTSWLWFHIVLDEHEPGGEWRYQVVYKGIPYEHKFQFINAQGIEYDKLEQQIILFPNPVTDILHIELTDTRKQMIQFNIYNSFGQKVTVKKQIAISNNSFELDVSMLNQGVYFIEFNTATRSHILKFVKM